MQAQQSLLYQVQQGLPNWPTNYKFAICTDIQVEVPLDLK